MLLTRRRQQQAIQDLMSGHPPTIDPDKMTDEYRFLWQEIEWAQENAEVLTPYQEAYQHLVRLKQNNPDLAPLIEDILKMSPGQQVNWPTLADLGPELPDLQWFWPNWIPRGMLSLLAAPGGVGKTNIALDLAHRCAGGQPGPDGQPLHSLTGNIIYVDAENFLPIIYQRAVAWNMNMRRLYPLSPPEGKVLDLMDRDYQDELKDLCFDTQPDLIIVDSLSTITLTAENNVEDMREILRFFNDLAQDANCALLLIHHTRKPKPYGQNGLTMHDLRGSGHIVNMARSVMGAYTSSDDPNGPRRLVMLKTNLCKFPRPLMIHHVATDNPAVAGLRYTHAPELDLSAAGIDGDSLIEQCCAWLLETLTPGPMAYSDLIDAAGDKFSQTTIQRARKKLDWQIIDTHGWRHPKNQWSIYGDEAKPVELMHSCSMSYGGGSKNSWGGVTHAACVHEFNANYLRQWQSEWENQWIEEWTR